MTSWDGAPATSRRLIVQVSAYYPPHLGGQEIIVQQLASHLAAAGEDVQVVTSNLGAKASVTTENGVRVSRLRSTELGHAAIIWGLFWWLITRTRRSAVVHLHVGQAFTPEIVWLASKLRRFKYIMHMHVDPVPSGAMGKLLPLYKKTFLACAVRSAQAVLVLNHHHRAVIRNDYRYKGNLVVISNGVGEEFFNLASQRTGAEVVKLLFVGRLSPQKNLPALLEAIGNSRQGLTLDIVGEGECRYELEAMISEKKLANVRLHGRLNRDSVRELYATHDALILPSLYEGQPVALLEAMASRIPVIATRVVGIETVVKDGAAILVEPTWQGLAAGIMAFTSMSSETKNRMVDIAFTRAQGFSWEALMESYVSLYY